MYHPLPASAKFITSVTLCAVIFGFTGTAAQSYPITVTPQVRHSVPKQSTLSYDSLEFQPEKLELANHGGEGSSGAVAGAAVTGSQVLALKGQTVKTASSDSLWGNLLLSMAYQRDPVIQKYVKRLGRVNTVMLLSVAGISGLGLAQSISALNNTHGEETLHIVDHGHGAHAHIEAESKIPATLGIIGSSATIATLGLKAVMDKHYSSKLTARQLVIKEQIEGILSQLKAGQEFGTIQPQLTQLVGPIATEEFAELWHSVRHSH